MKKTILIIMISLFLPFFSFANGEHDFTEAKEILEQKIPYEQMTDEQFEIVGDYFMELMMGDRHEIMDEMMGGEGSESLEIMHINMGRNYYVQYNNDGQLPNDDYVMPMHRGGMMWWNNNGTYGGNTNAGYFHMSGFPWGWFVVLSIPIIFALFFYFDKNKKYPYFQSKEVNMTYEEALEAVPEALAKEGFGVLCNIDVQATLKKKIGVDFDKYTILGACNPVNAHKALMLEDDLGLLLPCNVIVYEKNSKVFVSVILPTTAMSIVDNKPLEEIARLIEDKLTNVLASL